MRPKKPRKPCVTCGLLVENLRSIYCNNRCQQEQQYLRYIENWKAGRVTGNKTEDLQISEHVRRYLHERCGSRCEQCGWSKVNPTTGKVPLTVNHKDGNWRRSEEENLEVLCPCCHALTPTYGHLNVGSGRPRRLPHWKTGS